MRRSFELKRRGEGISSRAGRAGEDPVVDMVVGEEGIELVGGGEEALPGCLIGGIEVVMRSASLREPSGGPHWEYACDDAEHALSCR